MYVFTFRSDLHKMDLQRAVISERSRHGKSDLHQRVGRIYLAALCIAISGSGFKAPHANIRDRSVSVDFQIDMVYECFAAVFGYKGPCGAFSVKGIAQAVIGSEVDQFRILISFSDLRADLIFLGVTLPFCSLGQIETWLPTQDAG